MPERAIGGVFAAPDLDPSTTGLGADSSLWDHWTLGARKTLTFRNARSAFAHVLRSLAQERVWLPSYCCEELVHVVRIFRQNPLFYACDEKLNVDVETLARALRPGDIVLGVNYFGRAAEALRPLAVDRPDVTWIEDCAQCVDTAAAAWASYQLYSPRKLLGVADGGILVDRTGLLPPPVQRPSTSAIFRHAGLLRRTYEDDNRLWFTAFQRAEELMDVTDHAMSEQTGRTLRCTALGAISIARRRNYARLHLALADLALWSDSSPQWTPLGFPIRVPDAAAFSEKLARHRIFPPRHWATLSSETATSTERVLSRQLLTLPCDQRYSPHDMDRLSAVVEKYRP